MVINPVHFFHNLQALLSDRGFKIENGEFGLRLALQDAWTEGVARYMYSHSIRELRLNFNHVKQITVGSLNFLSALPDLEGIVLLDPSIQDLTPVNRLNTLRSLSLGYGVKALHNSVSLASLPRLERLYLSERIPNEEEVFQCTSLKRLGMTKFPAQGESTPFSNLAHLESLSLSACGLSEVRAFAMLKNLEEIDLALMKHLSSLEGVEHLKKLRRIKLENCPNIGSIEQMAGLSELEFLWLYDCGDIASLSPLRGLKNLREINLGGTTNIMDGDVAILKSLPCLERVGVVHRKHYNKRI